MHTEFGVLLDMNVGFARRSAARGAGRRLVEVECKSRIAILAAAMTLESD
jgi:hypothetical protein